MMSSEPQRSRALSKCVPAETIRQARRHTGTPSRTLSLVGWRPASSSAKRLPVELALHRIDRASVVESEHFIIQIQGICYRGEPFRQFVGSLQVDLQVRVEVGIPFGPCGPPPPPPAHDRPRIADGVLVGRDIRLVVGHSQTH